jgi:hypothetical protein
MYIYIYVENCIVNPNGHQSIKLGFWAVTSSDLEKHMSWGSRKTSGKSTKPLTRFLFGVWRWLPAEPTTDVTIYIYYYYYYYYYSSYYYLLLIIYIHTYIHICTLCPPMMKCLGHIHPWFGFSSNRTNTGIQSCHTRFFQRSSCHGGFLSHGGSPSHHGFQNWTGHDDWMIQCNGFVEGKLLWETMVYWCLLFNHGI